MKLELSLQGHSCWHTQASWRPQDDGGATAAVEGIESHHESQRNSRNPANTESRSLTQYHPLQLQERQPFENAGQQWGLYQIEQCE
jgi:hypothetical protein